MSVLWIVCTVLASAFQVARNGLQREIMAEAGPWGATLVRFLFGLPLSAALAAAALIATPGAPLNFTLLFWLAAGAGAAAQLLATASLLVALRRAGFAVGTALQQSSLPLAALIGLAVFHDGLTRWAWLGVGVTTLALLALTWPRQASGPKPVSGALFGLLSGLAFGLSLNAFRHASTILQPHHPVLAAVLTLPLVQALQTAALGGVLGVIDRRVLDIIIKGWRRSIGAGVCGSIASTGWFIALALAPAASVRAVGVIEAPIAALVGQRLFKERLRPWQLFCGAMAAGGVVLTALG